MDSFQTSLPNNELCGFESPRWFFEARLCKRELSQMVFKNLCFSQVTFCQGSTMKQTHSNFKKNVFPPHWYLSGSTMKPNKHEFRWKTWHLHLPQNIFHKTQIPNEVAQKNARFEWSVFLPTTKKAHRSWSQPPKKSSQRFPSRFVPLFFHPVFCLPKTAKKKVWGAHFETLIFQLLPEVWCFRYVFGVQTPHWVYGILRKINEVLKRVFFEKILTVACGKNGLLDFLANFLRLDKISDFFFLLMSIHE